MTDQGSDADRISDRDAAETSRRHVADRERAAKDVAERNRKAHEAAVKARKKHDALREGLRRGLSF